MEPKQNLISRASFLKTSGLALGGLATLSHYACKGDFGTLKKLILEGKTHFSVVIPKDASLQEQNAAGELRAFLSKIEIGRAHV